MVPLQGRQQQKFVSIESPRRRSMPENQGDFEGISSVTARALIVLWDVPNYQLKGVSTSRYQAIIGYSLIENQGSVA